MSRASLVGLASMLALTASCTLMSKGTPIELRYFSPEATATARPPRATSAPVARLRIGRLTSSTNLRESIVHRESAVEVDAYDTLRWTENPEDYVRRSLSHALFDDGQLEQVVGGSAVTLDVELVAFEEARRDGHAIGRIQLVYRLHDERTVLTSGVVTMERNATSTDIAPVVIAIGAAMDAASAELAKDVIARLRAR
jgi:ABC-type uncharacterized transport system auxiliary subunit